jgi:hypothetical protein
MQWFTHLALKNLFSSGRKITFFTTMSIIGVTLGEANNYFKAKTRLAMGRKIRH